MVHYKTGYNDSFDEAFSWIMEKEGIVLTCDPDDPGGMTLCGISREYNPNWEWWSEIDKAISNKKIKIGSKVPTDFICTYVASYYYNTYWLKYGCAEANVSKDLGKELFDQAVNPGPAIMIRNLQECLNTLNYNTKTKDKDVEDLVVDGKWGKKTRARLIEYAKKHNDFLVKAMNAKQATYYLSLSSSNVNMRKYVKGWMNRV